MRTGEDKIILKKQQRNIDSTTTTSTDLHANMLPPAIFSTHHWGKGTTRGQGLGGGGHGWTADPI